MKRTLTLRFLVGCGLLAIIVTGSFVLMLGRSERLIDPGSYGLAPLGPNTYRRPA